MLALKAAGLPKSARPFASFSHSRQPPLSSLVRRGGSLGHRTEARCVGHRAILEEHQIVLTDCDGLGLAGPPEFDRPDGQLAAFGLQVEVGDGAATLKIHAAVLQPGLKRADHRVVLIVDRALDAGERFDAAELLDEAVQVALELDGAVPGLERKGRGPHVPEPGLEEFRRQPVGDTIGAELVLAGQHELGELDPVGHREAHRGDVEDGAVGVHEAGLGVRLHGLIEFDCLVEHGLGGIGQRGNGFEQAPGALVIVRGEHAAATQVVTGLGIAGRIQAAAEDIRRLVNGDVAARHAAVADHECGRGERTDAAADEMGFDVSGDHGDTLILAFEDVAVSAASRMMQRAT